jgi:hypothetical protein
MSLGLFLCDKRLKYSFPATAYSRSISLGYPARDGLLCSGIVLSLVYLTVNNFDVLRESSKSEESSPLFFFVFDLFKAFLLRVS